MLSESEIRSKNNQTMERKYLFPHFSMSNRTLEKCLIKFTFTTRSKWKWICSRISFTHCFLYAFPFLRNNFRCLGRKHFMKYYFEGNFISDFRLTLSPLCAIYANDTQKRTCVIQVSLFFDKMVGAVFPHFSHQKHVKTLGENTIQYKKRFIERMKWYFVSKIVLIYMRKTFANMIMKVDILFQQWKVSTSFEIKSVFF